MQLNYGVRGMEKRKMMGFVMDDRKVERKVVVLSQNSHFLISTAEAGPPQLITDYSSN